MTALPLALTSLPEERQVGNGTVDTAGFATFPLAVARTTPSAARGMTRTTLASWGLEGLADDATVVVSELVTNALRYGLPTHRARPLPPASEAQPILLSLVHCGNAVLCAVFDPGHEVPQVREPDYFEESGRGLHVLESLAARWGWTTPDHNGKAVWALLMATGEGRDPGPEGTDWEPLTRLLLLLELLSGPSWLKSLGASAARPRAVERRRH
ncbi:ATP-binding protein [Streptomyces marincola]|uniref:ATP-binding protein n=1 Tax=Streptomyces marincola TaxID=2878388 RepID=UPI00131BCF8E|nr:ATP-binding protein [Streptomyces marincola]